MLFNSFKSTNTLEREVRDWKYDDDCIHLGERKAYNLREITYNSPMIDISQTVMETAFGGYERNKAVRTISGTWDTKENLRFIKGISLVQKLAKKRKWRIMQEGSAMLGYKIEIIEMP
ncbi:hypothetical protein N9H45_04490 [Opitutales bacterium]|nr:hypothetical protein [Opitutales bacterium]